MKNILGVFFLLFLLMMSPMKTLAQNEGRDLFNEFLSGILVPPTTNQQGRVNSKRSRVNESNLQQKRLFQQWSLKKEVFLGCDEATYFCTIEQYYSDWDKIQKIVYFAQIKKGLLINSYGNQNQSEINPNTINRLSINQAQWNLLSSWRRERLMLSTGESGRLLSCNRENGLCLFRPDYPNRGKDRNVHFTELSLERTVPRK